jgi:hypothetical protein
MSSKGKWNYGLRRRDIRILLWGCFIMFVASILKRLLPLNPFFSHIDQPRLRVSAWRFEGEELKTAAAVPTAEQYVQCNCG